MKDLDTETLLVVGGRQCDAIIGLEERADEVRRRSGRQSARLHAAAPALHQCVWTMAAVRVPGSAQAGRTNRVLVTRRAMPSFAAMIILSSGFVITHVKRHLLPQRLVVSRSCLHSGLKIR